MLKGTSVHLAYILHLASSHLAVANLQLLRDKNGFHRPSHTSGKANSFLPPPGSQGNSETQDSSNVITVQASNKLGFL